MSSHRPSLWRVLSETSRVISARSRHFLALSFHFLLPISIATIIFPFLLQTTSASSYHHRFLPHIPIPGPQTSPVGKSRLLIHVSYGLFILLLYIFAMTSITHSTFHAFCGRPLRFISSLGSILVSFLPLLATAIVANIVAGLILLAVGPIVLFLYTGLVRLGFDMDYHSLDFLVFVILIGVLLMVLLIYFQIEWYLTTVVVVVESQWGLAPLRRSSYLVKGMKWTVFSMKLFFGILYGLLSISYSNSVVNAGGFKEGWTSWSIPLHMVVYASLFTVLLLYNLAADTVVFVYCKELHGESLFQTDERFAEEYVRLLCDDGNVVKQ